MAYGEHCSSELVTHGKLWESLHGAQRRLSCAIFEVLDPFPCIYLLLHGRRKRFSRMHTDLVLTSLSISLAAWHSSSISKAAIKSFRASISAPHACAPPATCIFIRALALLNKAFTNFGSASRALLQSTHACCESPFCSRHSALHSCAHACACKERGLFCDWCAARRNLRYAKCISHQRCLCMAKDIYVWQMIFLHAYHSLHILRAYGANAQ
jgi:hypothetical protein